MRFWKRRSPDQSDNIVGTREEAAFRLKVPLRKLSWWLKRGCPGKPGQYDIDVIHEWTRENCAEAELLVTVTHDIARNGKPTVSHDFGSIADALLAAKRDLEMGRTVQIRAHRAPIRIRPFEWS